MPMNCNLPQVGRQSHRGLLKGQATRKGYSPLYWGNTLEPMVAKYYQEHTGNKVRRVNAILQHPEQRFMLANLDYAITGSDEVQILECKTIKSIKGYFSQALSFLFRDD